MMIKIVVIMGTRPEAIKLSPVVHELRCYDEKLETVVLTTAQHREMLDRVLSIFDILPNYDLDIMSENQSLTSVTSKVLSGVEKIIKKSLQ